MATKAELWQWVRALTPEKRREFEQMRLMNHKARIGVGYRLQMHKRVRAHFKARGWPQDVDLIAVVTTACACYVQGARGVMLRRPRAADGLRGLWPAAAFLTTAKQIVDTLELDDIVTNLDA